MTQKSRESSTDRGFLCYTYTSFMHTNMTAHHTHAVHHHIHLHGFTLTHRTCPLSAYIPLFLIGIICL